MSFPIFDWFQLILGKHSLEKKNEELSTQVCNVFNLVHPDFISTINNDAKKNSVKFHNSCIKYGIKVPKNVNENCLADQMTMVVNDFLFSVLWSLMFNWKPLSSLQPFKKKAKHKDDQILSTYFGCCNKVFHLQVLDCSGNFTEIEFLFQMTFFEISILKDKKKNSKLIFNYPNCQSQILCENTFFLLLKIMVNPTNIQKRNKNYFFTQSKNKKNSEEEEEEEEEEEKKEQTIN
ncbi:hypothetical protein M0812_12180 [Anaeramoeba flamelloides]|uniref:Uncharacterized protein n=1 Tax=Anaeramoeba flamelloides TaxID=1746091 RepID=A0AAV7ZM93_9EUKA|nr:hypothetical protein M0812_12180 [Anaeramoeba flamelloides]